MPMSRSMTSQISATLAASPARKSRSTAACMATTALSAGQVGVVLEGTEVISRRANPALSIGMDYISPPFSFVAGSMNREPNRFPDVKNL